MHLFAISGLNIAVIAGALQMLLWPLRRWSVVRFIAGATLLWLFVDITGAAPSAVRAFVMAVFLQAAWVLLKPGSVLAALVASAALVLVIAPFQVFGASFVMSYGIVAALLLLGLPLGEAWVERWSPAKDLPKAAWLWWHHAASAAWRWLAAALAVGLATTLVGLLTGIHYFGLFTPGALVTNLVLIPAAMVVTLGGFAALVCGLVGWAGGAVLCNHAAALVFLGIEWGVAQSVKVPGAFDLGALYLSLVRTGDARTPGRGAALRLCDGLAPADFLLGAVRARGGGAGFRSAVTPTLTENFRVLPPGREPCSQR